MAAVRYWIRLTHQPRSRLTRRVFDWDHDLALRGRRCWNKDIKDILTQAGHADVFRRASTDGVSDELILSNILTSASQRTHEQRLLAASTMSRMTVHNAIKSAYGTPEQYVDSRVFTRYERSVLARLRGGTLPIAIETGRYRQIPPHDRICKSCDTNHIENEHHFLFHCDHYNTIRDDLIHIDRDSSDSHNLINIFSNTVKTIQLAKYIMRALKDRMK